MSQLLGEIKCIWMGSKNVDYKLCDRNFDCDNCPFDKQLRQSLVESAQAGDTDKEPEKVSNPLIKGILREIDNIELIDKYSLFDNNLMIKHLFSESYYIGISPLGKALLDDITEFELSGRPGRINYSDSLYKISGSWGEINLKSSAGFTLVEAIDTPVSRFRDAQWFGVIQMKRNELDAAVIPEEKFNTLKSEIKSRLQMAVQVTPDIGRVAYDAGKPVEYLHNLIGNEEYHNILRAVFNC